MELTFCESKKRLFKKSFGDNFFKTHSRMGQGVEFGKFWNLAFETSDDPREVIEFLNTTEKYVKEGPVKKWLAWLRCKFIFFIWSDSKLNLKDLRMVLKLDDESFDNHLFFLASEIGYSNGFFLKEKIDRDNVQFEEFKYFFGENIFGRERLANLELGLFPSWKEYLLDVEGGLKIRFENKSRHMFKYFLGYFSSVVIGILIIFIFIFTSSQEASRVLKRLTISIPSFEKIDALNTFESIKPSPTSMVQERVSFDDNFEAEDSPDRFDTETEIEYLDYEKIKSRFASLAREQTEFEEETDGAFRETRYGYSTVYRLMIETADSYSFLNAFSKLKDKFDFQKAGDVEPGLFIPGGNYFNLLVPTSKFADILKELQSFNPMIYASRSREKRVPGKTKMFIFVNKL